MPFTFLSVRTHVYLWASLTMDAGPVPRITGKNYFSSTPSFSTEWAARQ
jgi:hypothetical protein